MAAEGRTTLKGYFETGDTPTQAQFENLIDSQLNTTDDTIDDIPDGINYKKMTTNERTNLSNQSGTNTGDETVTSVGTLISGATGKTTPVDADSVALSDSAASNILKKITWANIKTTLKTYFDTLYSAKWNETTVNLASAGWSASAQSETISGLTASSDVIVYPPSDRTAFLAYGAAQISATAISTDSITFTCTTDPTGDIDNVIVRWR